MSESVRSIAQQALAVLILLVNATCALAQPANKFETSISKLREAEQSADAVAHFLVVARDDVSKASKTETKEAFARLRQAMQVLLDFGPKSYSDDLLSLSQVRLRAVGARIPATLPEAIDECEKGNNLLIASFFAADLTTRLVAANEDLQAEAVFGKARENLNLYSGIGPPRTGLDLLHNIAFALDRDVVLRRDFYTEQNMAQFFGASNAPVYRKRSGEISVYWTTRLSAAEMDKMKAGEWKAKHCDYQVELTSTVHQKKSGRFSVTCTFATALSPTIAEVKSVFGKDSRETVECPVHPPLPPATSEYCNRLFAYNFDKSSIHRELTAKFEPGGTFWSLQIVEEER